MFPGDPGRNKTQHAFAEDESGWSCSMIKSGNKFRLRMFNKALWKEASAAIRTQARADEIDQITKARRQAEAAIADLPKSGAEYLNETARAFGFLVRGLLRPMLMGRQSPLLTMLPHGIAGYRIDEESLREFDETLTELVDVIRSARAIRDPASRTREEIRLRANAIPEDRGFSGFMRAVTEGADHA